MVLTTSLGTPAPSKALVQKKQATCERSKLRNSQRKADFAKDLGCVAHLPEESQVSF